MTKPKRAPKPKPRDPKTFAETKLPGGWQKIIRICEDLRERNTDGYIRKSLWLADVKNFGFRGRITKATVCSPFTGTVIGAAFDPEYPKDDQNGHPYIPKCDEGREDLPYDFYKLHNGGSPIGSLVKYKIGKKIDKKQARRGDVLAIDWVGGGGHLVFCWDVHLNADGEVDCFQMIGSHGSLKGNGAGVHIHGCTGERWLKGKPARFDEPGTGNMSKAKPQIFVDEDEIVREGTWFALPGVQDKSIDRTTFRVTPNRIAAPGGKWRGSRVNTLEVGRFFYDGDPPAPFCMKDGPPAPPQQAPEPRGHVVVPVVVLPKAEVKKEPEAIKKVEAKPVVQPKAKPLMMQKDVELAMQEFWRARWIDKDPGIPDEISDAKSKEAVKAFQARFGLDDDGIVGKITFGEIKKQLPACQLQEQAEDHLVRLFLGGKLKKDPGSPNGINDSASEAAFKEFQSASGLKETGVPDADTQAKLKAAIAEHAASDAKPGLSPRLEALYWLGNQVKPGGGAKLRLHAEDLQVGQNVPIQLEGKSGKAKANAALVVKGAVSEAEVSLPADFGGGESVVARVEVKVGGKSLSIATAAPLYVAGAATGKPTGPFRKFRITTYHVAMQGDPSAAETVPVYDKSKNVLARVTPAYFSEMALEGAGKLRDGRFLNVDGGKVSVSHDDYDGVLAHHKRVMAKRSYGYSGLVVKDDKVVQVSSFHEVTGAKLGKGYSTQRGIAYEPFKTLAADLGLKDNSEPKFKGKGGLVPAKTKVYIKEYDGVECPDGEGGKFVHDGWFLVNDTGGGIFGVHFDVFVGTRAMGKQVPHKKHMNVWFEGIEDRIPEDYDYGLED